MTAAASPVAADPISGSVVSYNVLMGTIAKQGESS